MVYLNAYDPVCPIGIKNCYVCQLKHVDDEFI